jgi:hypothetical protein
MRILSIILIASLLSATNAFAANTGPLIAGKPAGVHSAQTEDITPLIYFGAVAVGLGIALAVTNGNNNIASGTAGSGGGSTTTTSSTGTTA